jgi:sporulation protein YlmC with PRC-barrel domain
MPIKVSQILDSEIVDRNGRVLGKVRDLVLDAGVSGSVSYVLVTLPASSHDSAHTVALPWSVLAPACLDPDTAGTLMLDVRRSTLEGLRHIAGS